MYLTHETEELINVPSYNIMFSFYPFIFPCMANKSILPPLTLFQGGKNV